MCAGAGWAPAHDHGLARVLAKSNAEQVSLIRGIVERLGRQVATPDEARAILGLKGRDKVAF